MLLGDEQFVLLDEAISALDAKCDKQVQQAIDVLISRSAVIMAAHRLNLIRKADRIIRVNEGHMGLVPSYKALLMESEKWIFLRKMQRIMETKIEGRTA